MPFSPFHLIAALLLLAFMVAFIQVGALTIAFDKLGLSPESGFALLLVSLLGSAINLPLFRMKANPPPPDTFMVPLAGRLLRIRPPPFTGSTVIAINVGGGLVPVFFSAYLFRHTPIDATTALLAIAIVTFVCYAYSRPIPGLGIGMPIFVAPLSAALTAVLLDGDASAPLAYICGSLGVLLGADILRLRDIPRLGAPIASIGGAGTFDGIFITGIVAVLLA